VLRDLWQALRTLRRDARLTAFAILVVGLGVGAAVTVFSVVQALLLRPLPFREPGRLVWVDNRASEQRAATLTEDLSARTVQVAHLETLRAQSRTLADVAGFFPFYGRGDHSLTGPGEPERLTGVQVTANFFPLLGVGPAAGRGFTAEESRWGGPKAVLLSHAFWARRFAADPGVVGRPITLDGEPVTVVGVLPAAFDFGSVFAPGTRVDYFAPFPLSPETNQQGNTLILVGHLRPGATPAAAQREAAALVNPGVIGAGPIDERRPDGLNAFAPRVRALRAAVSGAYRPALLLLAGAVGLVLLLVCANLANLLLTRAVAREQELALRAALGAGRGRLARLLLMEGGVLAGAGAAVGVGLAAAGTGLVARLAQTGAVHVPLLDQVRVDGPALAVAAVAALLTGVLVGAAPALRASGSRGAGLASHAALKGAGRGASAGAGQGRLRGALVVGEVALACVLLVGAGLLGRSFVRVLDQELGFRPQGAVAVRIDARRAFAGDAQRTAYYADALRRVRATPGVQAAALTDVLPFGFNRQWGVRLPGQAPGEDSGPAYVRVVSEGYLRAMGVPLRAGRDFAAADAGAGRPVVLVNEALARALWTGQNPLGRVLTAHNVEWEVVGVVAGTRHQALETAAGPEVYFPMRQLNDYGAVHVVVRGPQPPAALAASVGTALRPMDPALPLTEVRVLEALVDQSVAPRRLVAWLLGGFAGFALALATLGLYAVIAYGVAQRTRELGIRLALGATPGDVQGRVLAGTLRLAAAGLGVGLAAAWALARVMRGLLFGIGAADPATLAGALVVLGGAAALAGYLPARRAARLSPVAALRAE
jgi:predicted permease